MWLSHYLPLSYPKSWIVGTLISPLKLTRQIHISYVVILTVATLSLTHNQSHVATTIPSPWATPSQLHALQKFKIASHTITLGRSYCKSIVAIAMHIWHESIGRFAQSAAQLCREVCCKALVWDSVCHAFRLCARLTGWQPVGNLTLWVSTGWAVGRLPEVASFFGAQIFCWCTWILGLLRVAILEPFWRSWWSHFSFILLRTPAK